MTTYSIELLSGSTQGKPVKVVATSSTGTTIHTAIAGTTDIDLISLWVTNNDTVARTLTLEWGTTTAADGNIIVTIPSKAGPVFVCDRQPLQNGLLVTAFADAANVLLVLGHVERVDKP